MYLATSRSHKHKPPTTPTQALARRDRKEGITQDPRTTDDARMASTSGNDNIDDDDDAQQQQQPPSATESGLRNLKYMEHAAVRLEADAERTNDIVVAEGMGRPARDGGATVAGHAGRRGAGAAPGGPGGCGGG
ncbi:hypothetical protein DL764_009270 [Monosporascus ibericus]|uniref:Uncharacterized protein n=1 Tax=Monosporascus ibericus TaxID=155417 RepID=A0A4Q4SVG6_9PEZI|nr:hypothetical protein DL764_009270 [Monosporascus ibericus]